MLRASPLSSQEVIQVDSIIDGDAYRMRMLIVTQPMQVCSFKNKINCSEYELYCARTSHSSSLMSLVVYLGAVIPRATMGAP